MLFAFNDLIKSLAIELNQTFSGLFLRENQLYSGNPDMGVKNSRQSGDLGLIKFVDTLAVPQDLTDMLLNKLLRELVSLVIFQSLLKMKTDADGRL